MRVLLVKLVAACHVAFMAFCWWCLYATLYYPHLAPWVFVMISVTALSWLFWPMCFVSEIENRLRRKAGLKPMNRNFISFYAKLFFGLRLSDFFVGSIVYGFSAILWLASLAVTLSQF